MLSSLSGASVCAFRICPKSKNFIRRFCQSKILSWSVSTYIRSVRGVIQLIRSKCVRFQDFSRANTSPPPQLSLCFHQQQLFLSKNKPQLKSLLCLLCLLPTPRSFSNIILLLWDEQSYFKIHLKLQVKKIYLLVSLFNEYIVRKNLTVFLLLFRNMMVNY